VRDIDSLPIDKQLWVKLIIPGPSRRAAAKRRKVIDGNRARVSQQSAHTRSVVLHAIGEALKIRGRRAKREKSGHIAVRTALFRAGALFRNGVGERGENVEVMARLGTARGEEAENSFGTLESALSLKLGAGLSKVVNTKYEACGEDKCSAISLVLLQSIWDATAYFIMHMLLASKPVSSASTHVCARNTAASRHASLIGDSWFL